MSRSAGRRGLRAASATLPERPRKAEPTLNHPANHDRPQIVRRKRIVVAIVLVVLLAAAAAGAVAFLRPGPDGPRIDSSAADYSIPGYENPDGGERGRIRIPTYSQWDMQAGADEIEVPLVNTEGNPCYMQFTVKLKDTGEVLYESDLVPPGKAVPSIRLNRTLDAGTYPVTVSISTFSLDDPSQPLNGAELGTEIVAS